MKYLSKNTLHKNNYETTILSEKHGRKSQLKQILFCSIIQIMLEKGRDCDFQAGMHSSIFILSICLFVTLLVLDEIKSFSFTIFHCKQCGCILIVQLVGFVERFYDAQLM